MQGPNANVAAARALIRTILVRSWEYRYPRFLAGVRVTAGIWVIVVGAILCGAGYWWGALLMVIGALTIVVAGLMFTLVTAPAQRV
jgi:hypothetical protein